MNSEHLHPEGRPYTKEEFVEKIKTDKKFSERFGDLGPVYGKQWRNWEKYDLTVDNDFGNGEYGGGWNTKQIDQIANLINDLKTNPDSRRLMVNAWNVGELDQMVLPPCHYGFQVYTRELSLEERKQIVKNKYFREFYWKIVDDDNDETTIFEMDKRNIPTRAISLMWNQRSVDTFLGLPFNIASYGLLLEIIAKEVNMIPDELIGNLGDVHLYSNHIEQAKEQIGRHLTYEERLELLKQAMGEEFEKTFELPNPPLSETSMYFAKYKISPGLHTRKPFPLPNLKFNPCPITGISMEYQSIAQFEIENYQSHPAIKAPLSN